MIKQNCRNHLQATGKPYPKSGCEVCGGVFNECKYAGDIEIYTIQPHGDGYAIYQGRTSELHGFNLANCTEVDLVRIQKLLDRANLTVNE